MISAGSYTAGLSQIKATGLYSSEIALDKTGRTIYTGTNVGQQIVDGNGFVAVQYNYVQNYKDGIYANDMNSGDSILVIDSFDKYMPTNSIVYNLQPSGTAQTQSQNLALNDKKLEYTGTVSSVIKVLEWNGYNTAKGINFSNGVVVSFDEISIADNGEIQNINSIDLRYAYSTAELLSESVSSGNTDTGAGSPTTNDAGTQNTSVLEQYANILNGINGIKFENQDQLYGVFDQVSASHIDMTKAVYVSAVRNINTGLLETSGISFYKDINGLTTLVEVGVDGLEKTSDWRDWSLKTGQNSVAKGSYIETDGETYSRIYTTTNITFTDPKSTNFTLSFRDPSKNTLKINTGDLQNGTFTSVEYTDVVITQNGETLSYDKNKYENIPSENSEIFKSNSDVFLRNYKNGMVIGGYDSYAAKSTVNASLLPKEYVDANSAGDTIVLDSRTTFEWVADDKGILTAKDNVKVNGLYQHKNPDGTVVSSRIYTQNENGKLVDGAVFEVGTNGAYVLNGEIKIDANNTWTTKNAPAEPSEPSNGEPKR